MLHDKTFDKPEILLFELHTKRVQTHTQTPPYPLLAHYFTVNFLTF